MVYGAYQGFTVSIVQTLDIVTLPFCSFPNSFISRTSLDKEMDRARIFESRQKPCKPAYIFCGQSYSFKQGHSLMSACDPDEANEHCNNFKREYL
jgi:hypothetical protein